MDIIEIYVLIFLLLKIANMIKYGCLYTHILLSIAIEIPIIGRVFRLW